MHTCQPLWRMGLLAAIVAALPALFAGCDNSSGSTPANDASAAPSTATGAGKVRPGAKTVALAAATVSTTRRSTICAST
jgi:hypothetical protein